MRSPSHTEFALACIVCGVVIAATIIVLSAGIIYAAK